MPPDVARTRSRWRVFWPEVDTLSGAQEAIRFGCWFAFLAAGLSAVGAIISVTFNTAGLPGLADAVFLGLIGLGLRRRWRSAAIVGAMVLATGMGYTVSQGSVPGMVGTLTLLGMINGVRGTFAFRALSLRPGSETP